MKNNLKKILCVLGISLMTIQGFSQTYWFKIMNRTENNSVKISINTDNDIISIFGNVYIYYKVIDTIYAGYNYDGDYIITYNAFNVKTGNICDIKLVSRSWNEDEIHIIYKDKKIEYIVERIQ